MVMDSTGDIYLIYFGYLIYKFKDDKFIVLTDTLNPIFYYSSIVIDKFNTFWGSTDRGLMKYDGSQLINYDSTKFNLKSNKINYIEFDKNNNLWLHYDDSSFYYRATFKLDYLNNYQSETRYSDSLLQSYLRPKIKVDDNNNIWIISKRGFNIFDGVNWNKIDKYKGFPYLEHDFGIYAFDIEKDSIAWFSTIDQKGQPHLFRMSPNYFFEEISIPQTSPPSPAKIKYILAITVDRYGNKWIGTDIGLFVFNEYGVILGVDDQQTEQAPAIAISPNPASNFITISLSKDLQPLVQSKNNIRIYNSIGEFIFSVALQNPESQRIDISVLPPGLYFVRYGSEYAKFIKE
jgi:hypothetical protein